MKPQTSTTLAGLLFCAALAQTAHAGLIAAATGDAATLTGNLAGNGITIVGTPSYSGASGAAATFTGGNSAGLGVDTGVLLTTGQAANAAGPNMGGFISASNGTAGDADLSALVAGANTYDAATLEFDFTSATGNLYLNFVFASDEYNSWIDSFPDVFGVFVNGINIALTPGTAQPISVENINCGYTPGTTTGPNCGLFNNNDFGTSSPYNLGYNGFTTVLTAQATGLGTGTNHLKLAIADGGDSSIDSGVFIQGKSLSAGQPIPEPSAPLLLLTGLVGIAVLTKRARSPKIQVPMPPAL